MTFYIRFFGLIKIPLLFYCRPKVVSIDEESVEIKIPLKRRTKNHLGSMYLGALSVGADITSGILALETIKSADTKISLVFKDFKANFFKRAEGDVHFVCKEGKKIKSMVENTLKTGERINKEINVEAFVPKIDVDNPVAAFVLTLSLKAH